MSADIVKHHVERAARRAHIGQSGVHRLRHTFCPHLAMRGAPARAIQELAGHKDLSTTQRYMHLSPAAIEGAIRLLEMSLDEAGLHEENSRGDIFGDGGCVIRYLQSAACFSWRGVWDEFRNWLAHTKRPVAKASRTTRTTDDSRD